MELVSSIALAVDCGILGFVIRAFSDSYVREKGKNAATKEDIGDITRVVEDIRAELTMLSSFSNQRRDKQELHLLAFHDVALKLLHERYAVNFADLPLDEGRSLFEFQTKFHENIVTLLREFQRVALFIPKERKLASCAQEMMKTAIASQAVFKKNYGQVKSTAINEALAYSSGDKASYRAAVEKANFANDKYWSEMRSHIEAFRASFEAFATELTAFLEKPHDAHAN
ncbi:MAG: hypothetical protein K1X48_11520 [Burkholderiaceae bacterium]|nr:hypothetical protein [Burkholderiaceae bacterium]